jgi:hypothetical protein
VADAHAVVVARTVLPMCVRFRLRSCKCAVSCARHVVSLNTSRPGSSHRDQQPGDDREEPGVPAQGVRVDHPVVLRGAYMMTATPARQINAPMMS